MTLAYIKPGVAISEVVSPSFSPLLLDPTSICLVGRSQGFATTTEIFVLEDNSPVRLAKLNVDPNTVVLRDASNVTQTPFSVTNDYVLDTSQEATTGVVTIARAMQTTILNGQKVVVYFENSGSPAQADGKTDFITLNGITGVVPTDAASGTQAGTIQVMSEGSAPVGDYLITGNGGATPTITWQSGATVLRKFQKVYIDYTVDGATTTDAVYQLNNLTAVNLPANATVTHVKTAPGASTTTDAVVYQLGSGTTLDYVVTGTGATTTIARSIGSTTIGGTNNKATVKITYQATPADYWLPTRCFSQGDVEAKYGPSFDSAGNILNEISFAASLAFQNGASSVIIQAVFHEGTPRTQTDGSADDWSDTFTNLYDIEDITVVVPVLPVGTNDGLALQILTTAQNYLNYMAQNQNQYVMAFVGEDSTTGLYASESTLQAHAQTLGSGTPSDSVVFVSPASFTFANPVTGSQSLMGGQFKAACLAGMLARYSVQTPLTRKLVAACTGVNDVRTEIQKNADAQAGLCVIEAKRGAVQVRDAITTSQQSVAARALNVVRAKHFVMKNIALALDTQVIGQIVISPTATFQVKILVTAVLQQMVNQGVIVSFDSVQVIQDANVATQLDVQFSYLPAYPLNRISISFSLDSSQGVVFNTTASPLTQGI